LIPKEQWDGFINDNMYEFIPLAKGKALDYITDNGKIVNIRKYYAIAGILKSLKDERDYGSFAIIYKDDKDIVTYEIIRSIRAALRYEARFLLRKDSYTWKSIISAIITTIDPIVLIEFKKIIQTFALGTKFYEDIPELSMYDLEWDLDELDMREMYYKIYKCVFNGILDYDTFVEITEIDIDTVIYFTNLDPDLIENLPFRIERALKEKENKEKNNG